MKRIHIVGRKNHGKTQLVVDLVEEFRNRGLTVGTIKHTHHQHELDTPGKDSHRHRTAGASVVGILSQSMNAVFIPTGKSADSPDGFQVLAPMFEQCDITLVEGNSQTDALKIEVWRAELEVSPMAIDDPTIRLIVSDSAPPAEATVLRRSDVSALADWIVAET